MRGMSLIGASFGGKLVASLIHLIQPLFALSFPGARAGL